MTNQMCVPHHRARSSDGDDLVIHGNTELIVLVSHWGFDHGWALFPMNMDPIWVMGCTGKPEEDSQ